MTVGHEYKATKYPHFSEMTCSWETRVETRVETVDAVPVAAMRPRSVRSNYEFAPPTGEGVGVGWGRVRTLKNLLTASS